MTQSGARNAQQLVYSSLRASILSLNLVPGTVISENEISQRFKVSRTPVREAFIALSREALVTVMPQKGSMVSRIDFARVAQELFLRENLEKAALKRFVAGYEPARLAELETYIELQAEAGENKRFEKFFEYDNLFHHTFFHDQPVAWEALELMCGHYSRVRLLSISLLDIIKVLVEEHKQLLQAVKERDAPKAMARLESHLRKPDNGEDILKRLFPDYFEDQGEAPPVVDFGGLNTA